MGDVKKVVLLGGEITFSDGLLMLDINSALTNREYISLNVFFRDLGVTMEDCLRALAVPAPANYHTFHHVGCGTEERGCHARCPKDLYERTGIWLPEISVFWPPE